MAENRDNRVRQLIEDGHPENSARLIAVAEEEAANARKEAANARAKADVAESKCRVLKYVWLLQNRCSLQFCRNQLS